MIGLYLADGADSSGTAVGALAGAIGAVLVALIGAWTRNGTRRRRVAKAKPEPPAPVTAAESAANLNLINLQNMLDKDRASFERYREETERSENEFRRQVSAEIAQLRAELEYRDTIIQQVEEELIAVKSGVLAGTIPPFPDRRPRPPRPIPVIT